MPIKGKILAHPFKNHIGMMTVGQIAYLDAECLIITRKAVFIDLFSRIILEEDFYDELNDQHVSIKRIGEGTSQKDFELDLTILDDFEYYIEDTSTFLNAMKKKPSYIVFNNFELVILVVSNKVTIEEMPETVESLNEALEGALSEEDYTRANELREKIETLKNKPLT